MIAGIIVGIVLGLIMLFVILSTIVKTSDRLTDAYNNASARNYGSYDGPYVIEKEDIYWVNIDLFLRDLKTVKDFKLYTLNGFPVACFSNDKLINKLFMVEINSYSNLNDCDELKAKDIVKQSWEKKGVYELFFSIRNLIKENKKNKENAIKDNFNKRYK